MSQEISLGTVNGHVMGICMKEWVNRIIGAVNEQRYEFEVQRKNGYDGKSMGDVFTTVDKAAQELYLRFMGESFPGIGVVAEEDSLSIPCTDGTDTYFTVDPIDGTKAFIREQSHGVSTMLALVRGGSVLAAYVGDINTGEIYGFRPGSEKVHRIFTARKSKLLKGSNRVILRAQHILLREPERKYSEVSQRLIVDLFKSSVSDGGSIGTWFARLWKREVGAALLTPSWETPWDSTPVIGISQKLGYKFLKPHCSGRWVEYTPLISSELYTRDHDVLVIHEDDVKASANVLLAD